MASSGQILVSPRFPSQLDAFLPKDLPHQGDASNNVDESHFKKALNSPPIIKIIRIGDL